jgi:hypothetical protein
MSISNQGGFNPYRAGWDLQAALSGHQSPATAPPVPQIGSWSFSLKGSGSALWNEGLGFWDTTGGAFYQTLRHPFKAIGGLIFLASALPNSSVGYGGDIGAQMQIYDAASAWGSKVASGDPRAFGQAVGAAATLAYAAENLRIGANASGGGGLNMRNLPTRGSRIGFEVGKWKGGSGFHMDVYIKRIPGGWKIWETAKGMGSNWYKLEHWQPWK